MWLKFVIQDLSVLLVLGQRVSRSPIVHVFLWLAGRPTHRIFSQVEIFGFLLFSFSLSGFVSRSGGSLRVLLGGGKDIIRLFFRKLESVFWGTNLISVVVLGHLGSEEGRLRSHSLTLTNWIRRAVRISVCVRSYHADSGSSSR